MRLKLYDEGPQASKQDLYLLLSLLVVAVVHPLLDHGRWQRLVLGLITFVPLVIATVRTSRRKILLWTLITFITTALICGLAAYATRNYLLLAIQWGFATIAFGLAVGGMFSYLRQATSIRDGHLYIATSIYLLIGVFYFSLYSLVATLNPGAFETTTGRPHSAADLLYFSVVTLTTLGYGDIIPANGFTRMLAGLEAATGVMYVAITVSLLVSGYRPKGQHHEP